MNLRRITLRYLGWCPGVNSAARFIPDKEIPLIYVYVLITIAALGVSVPYFLFFVPAREYEYNNINPSLIQAFDGRFILALATNWPYPPSSLETRAWIMSSIDLLDWSEPIHVAEIGCGHESYGFRRSFALLQAPNGMFVITYVKISPDQQDIILARSSDLKTWSEPLKIAESFIDPTYKGSGTRYGNPSLIQTPEGELVLSFEVREYVGGKSDERYIMVTRSKDGAEWSSPLHVDSVTVYGHEGPHGIELAPSIEPSLFLCQNGSLGMVLRYEENNRTGIYIITSPDGVSWSRPDQIDHLPTSAHQPKVVPSVRGGYYLICYGGGGPAGTETYYLYVSFSEDLVHWSPNYPNTGVSMARYPVLIETENRTLYLAYQGESLRQTAKIYIIKSSDGVVWSGPIQVPLINSTPKLPVPLTILIVVGVTISVIIGITYWRKRGAKKPSPATPEISYIDLYPEEEKKKELD